MRPDGTRRGDRPSSGKTCRRRVARTEYHAGDGHHDPLGWASYGATVAGIYAVAGYGVFLQSVRPLWTVGFALLTPLLALFSALAALMVSTRVNDVRVAQGIASIGVLPIIGFATYVILAGKYLTLSFVLLCTAVLVPLDLLLLVLATRLFQREAIICRWK